MAPVMAPRSSGRLAPAAALMALVCLLSAWSWEPASRTAAPLGAFVGGARPAARGHLRSPGVAMQSEKVDAIIAELKELTLLEASELVKAIEDTFDVDASASGGAVMMAAPAGGGGAAEEEAVAEKTDFDVILKEVPKDKKIAILKVVRGLTGLGLKDAKGMVDNPGKVLEAKPKDIAEDAKKQLEEAGAKVELE